MLFLVFCFKKVRTIEVVRAFQGDNVENRVAEFQNVDEISENVDFI
jgi:hypothetical protein